MIKRFEKYYCDRCGQEIPTSNNTEIKIKGDNLRLQKLHLRGVWNTTNLCQDCRDSFTKWWNGRR